MGSESQIGNDVRSEAVALEAGIGAMVRLGESGSLGQ
jgi:hypothetical protein